MRKIMLCGLLLALSSSVLRSQELALSTNAVDYVGLGTLNAELSYGVSRHWSVSAGVKYNPFTFSEGPDAVQNRQRSVRLGARYWPWHIYSGWWMGCRAGYQEYNAGGIRSSDTTEGDRYGAGLSGGYSYMLAPHLNLDFGVGFWSGRDGYVTYACPTCGRILEQGSRYFVLPDDIIVALTFIF